VATPTAPNATPATRQLAPFSQPAIFRRRAIKGTSAAEAHSTEVPTINPTEASQAI
jgi:hypothetical protein